MYQALLDILYAFNHCVFSINPTKEDSVLTMSLLAKWGLKTVTAYLKTQC